MDLLSAIRARSAQWWATPTISLGSDPNIYIMPINETSGVLSETPFNNSNVFIGIMSTRPIERPYLSNQHEALDYLRLTPDMLARLRLILSHHPEDLELMRPQYTQNPIPPPSRPISPTNYLPRPFATSPEEVAPERRLVFQESLHRFMAFLDQHIAETLNHPNPPPNPEQ